MRLPTLLRLTCGALILLVIGSACNLSFSTTLPVVTPRPSVIFIAPDSNATIAEGAPVQIAVNAVDPTGKGVTHVDFTIDGTPLGTQTAATASGQSPMSALQIWTATGTQHHLIEATAYRADGSSVGYAALTISVIPITALPTITGTATATLTPFTPTMIPSFTPSVTIITIVPALLGTLPAGMAQTLTAAPPIAASVGPSSTPNTSGGPTITVLAQTLNVRGGPGTTYPIIGVIPKGQTAAIVGRNSDISWWVVQQGSLRGWVVNVPTFVQVSGNINNVPLVAVPPSPTPGLISPTPIPALIPTSTP